LASVSTPKVLELAEMADSLGFDALWLNEEHFQGSNLEIEGRRCPSPPGFGRGDPGPNVETESGFSVLLVPLHHPIRLAEEIATLERRSRLPRACDLNNRAYCRRFGSLAAIIALNTVFGFREQRGETSTACLA
jgi:hypothetical protein